MRLEYNILWIDNNLDDYVGNGSVESINEFLREKGFNPQIQLVYDEGEIDKYLNVEYDLIISDFNLNKENGDVVIYKLRAEKDISTEIFFYSARTNFMEDEGVKEKMAFMERINFHFSRDNLMEKIENVIELTLKKLLNINATRGLITAETSDLDAIIEDITINLQANLLKKSQEDLDKLIADYIDDFLAKSPQRFMAKHQEIGFANSMKFIEANRKWKMFRASLKEYNKKIQNPAITEFLQQNKTYFNDVIDIRNKFAHARAEEKDGKLVLLGQYGKEDFEFDEAACISIRRNLIMHRENIESIKELITKT